jgi:hypothetical protein
MREVRRSSVGLLALSCSGFEGKTSISVPATCSDSSTASGSTGWGMKAMTPIAIVTERAVNIRGLRIAGHICIQEILLVPESTQQPTKIMKTNFLQSASVSQLEFSKMQLKEKIEPFTITETWKWWLKARPVMSEQHRVSYLIG